MKKYSLMVVASLLVCSALASMTSDDGNTILIEDYYDDLRPMDEEEQRVMHGVLENLNEEQLKQSLGVER